MDFTTKKLSIPGQSKKIILLLFFFLLITTGAIIFTTWQNLRSVRAVADQSIQNLAMALSLSVENSLRSRNNPAYDDISRIFSDRIVAYAFIADRDGRIIYHTNPLLIGSIAENKEQINALFRSQTPIGRRTTLRTGTPVYQFRYILRLAKGRDEVLELVLNRSASDKVVAEAGQIWWTVAAILTGFWTIGFILAWTLIRYTGLQEELEERKRMALIGQMTAWNASGTGTQKVQGLEVEGTQLGPDPACADPADAGVADASVADVELEGGSDAAGQDGSTGTDATVPGPDASEDASLASDSAASQAANEDEGGCGCAVPGRRSWSGWIAVALIGLVAMRRRSGRWRISPAQSAPASVAPGSSFPTHTSSMHS